ncbi:MAG: MarR family EPS-associated transcriptional regulator [Rhodocyclaceae bacterium]|nr:MarR family EPS-associated transcriptional regulator [Rhodocyclaceae bacterium]MBP6110563.1 MarR family EPS-associated transcriptional regulator [Rhodocyclaceae bacterium]
MTPNEQVRFRILRTIEQDANISQRELSRLLGVSKGKTHYLLAALVEKGLLKMGNFGRTEGKLGKVSYLLTPEGVRSRAELTRNYLARKEAEYEALWAEIKALRHEGADVAVNAALLSEQPEK